VIPTQITRLEDGFPPLRQARSGPNPTNGEAANASIHPDLRVIAGAIVGVPLSILTLTMSGQSMMHYGMLVGYLIMLIALSAIIPRHQAPPRRRPWRGDQVLARAGAGSWRSASSPA